MPTYSYTALTREGKQARGNLAAESAAAARHLLRSRRLHVTDIRQVREGAQGKGFRLTHLLVGRRRREVLEFTRQLATMVDSGVKLTEALRVLSAAGANPRLGQVVQNLRDQVMAGEGLAESMRGYGEWFDPIYVAMVRVGEVTGTLGPTLKLLADYMSKRIRLDAKIKSALMYPTVLVVVCVIVVIILMTFVVPMIGRILTESGRELPAMTQVLMGVSSLFVNWWWLLLLVAGAVFYGFRRLLADSRGRLLFDRALLRLPVLGKVIRQSVVARFTSTLAALMRSGLPMAESLRVVADVTGNAVMSQAVRQARERIIAGADIATPLQKSQVVDATVGHMIAIGERAGELESMLVTIAESMEENADITVQRISSVIEPAVILVMGVVVGLIIMGTLLPILEISSIKM